MKQIKKIFTIILIVVSVVGIVVFLDIYLSYEDHKEVNDFFELQQPEFNKEKDEYINSVIDSHNVVFKKKVENLNSASYTIQYPTLRLTVYHDYYIPYHQKEKWTYWATDSIGNDIILQPKLKQYGVSNSTLDRIQNICFRIEDKYNYIK